MTFFIPFFIIAAASGTFFRWIVSLWFPAPWGTFSVNFVGSFFMGFLFLVLQKQSPHLQTILLVALLGSVTTYSSYSLDCLKMIQQSQWKLLTLYFFTSNLLCVVGCFFGYELAKKVGVLPS